MAYLYILKLKDNTCYCGITQYLVKRISDHQKGKSRSTRRKLPLVIKYVKEYPTMQAARLDEIKIKKQGPCRWWVKNSYSIENLVPTVTDDTRAEYIVRKIVSKETNSQQPTANNIHHTGTV